MTIGQDSTETTEPRTEIIWRPQRGPQKALIDCPLPEVFFGGARGGGKTDGVLGKWALKEQQYGSNFNAIMFRRTTVSSEDAIERSKDIYRPLGGKYNESKLIWRMPNGGRVAFAYLDTVRDADEYQGRNCTDAWVEEAGQYPSPAPIDRLFGVLRSAHGVPTQLILTANPGGAGQGWIRDRYKLVPFPKYPNIVAREHNGVTIRMAIIPSRISDNRILLHGDPQYVTRLNLVGGKKLVQAWLDGDWNAIEGAFFDEWDEKKHVIDPFDIPEQWMRFRSADWGSAKPFSVGWWAVATDDYPLPQRVERGIEATGRDGPVIPRGALARYREWYGCIPGQVNTGLKLAAETVGLGIAEREGDEKLTYGVLDPSAFAEDGGPSIGERMNTKIKLGKFRPADNKRVSQRGAMGGWDMMRSRLAGQDGRPMLYVFETCKDFIRTVPLLQHDLDKPEDLDTEAEDHVADEARYACMSRPWIRKVEKPEPKNMSGYTAVRNDPQPGDWKSY